MCTTFFKICLFEDNFSVAASGRLQTVTFSKHIFYYIVKRKRGRTKSRLLKVYEEFPALLTILLTDEIIDNEIPTPICTVHQRRSKR